MTSHDREFMNRVVDQDRRDRRRRAHHLLRRLRVLRAAARADRRSSSEAQYERQQAMLAKERRFIERFKARASHAAQVQSRVKKLEKIEKVEPPKRRADAGVRLPAPRRARATTWPSSTSVTRATASAAIYDGLDFLIRRARALVRDGRERRRQVARCSSWSRASASPTTARSPSARA